MSIHHFNIKIAEAYGINEAIILQNLSFWQAKNEANEYNFHDERYWVYNSVKAFECLFPYWSKGQINRILNSLEEKEAIKIGNYNKSNYDRTKWFSLNQEIHLLITGNGVVVNGKPIPDRNTDRNTDVEDIPTREIAFKALVKEKWVELGGANYMGEPEAIKFCQYWTEHGDNDKKMRFEKQASFGIGRRLGTWKKGMKDTYSEGRNNA